MGAIIKSENQKFPLYNQQQ